MSYMKNYIDKIKDRIKQEPLFKNILIMVGGTGIAQVLPIISAPILTRLYLPEHFGTYALFYSLVTIIYGVATLDYHNIIIIGDTQQKSFLGLSLSLLVTISICFIVLLILIIVPNSLVQSIFGDKILSYLYFLPITVFFSVLSNILYNWFLRQGDFKYLSKNKIILAICAMILQISIGFFQLGALGFIIANLLATIIATSLMLFKFNREYHTLYNTVSLLSLRKIGIEYKKFSLVSVWANSLNIFTLQIPDLLLNKLFGSFVLGQYSLSQRMITLPSSFVASSLQEVFKQTASQEERETGNCRIAYIRTLKISTTLALLLLIACLTFIPTLFVWVFGSKWSEAGSYVRVMCFLFAIRFIVPTLSYVFYIKNKQQIDLFWQIGLFILTVSTLLGGYYFFEMKDSISLLMTYSLTLSFWYIVNLFFTYSLVFNENNFFKNQSK